MGVEIERKYLLKNSNWKNLVHKSIGIQQGYLNSHKERSVRIRIMDAQAWLTIKGISIGASRAEYEYNIPLQDGLSLIQLSEKPIIEKTRHFINMDNQTWEIDEFHGDNLGLIVAEVELDNEDQVFKIPEWIGQEVTTDPRFYNVSLLKNPFSQW